MKKKIINLLPIILIAILGISWVYFLGCGFSRPHTTTIYEGEHIRIVRLHELNQIDSLFVTGTGNYIEAGLDDPEFRSGIMRVLGEYAEEILRTATNGKI